ncbi:hypothetical protein [Teredinibacter turnerae]|uniref:hypothetical protein n=1 Tax=Teredinibacter turnerae TaxID=2426 RepID=UPI000381A1AB|nr:hypothetical protein [Teredinibacter turnerae]
MKEPNELLGYWTCPQGGRAEVFQTKKRGNHFYTRCKCCGLNQGTGAERQQRIYDEAQFKPEVTFKVPSNVKPESDSEVHEVREVKALESDFDPTAEPEVSEPEPARPIISGGAKTGLALLAFSAAVGVAAWMN